MSCKILPEIGNLLFISVLKITPNHSPGMNISIVVCLSNLLYILLPLFLPLHHPPPPLPVLQTCVGLGLHGFVTKFFWGEDISPMPNLQHGGPGTILSVCLGWLYEGLMLSPAELSGSVGCTNLLST